jgi:hypothetical protein
MTAVERADKLGLLFWSFFPEIRDLDEEPGVTLRPSPRCPMPMYRARPGSTERYFLSSAMIE